MNNFNEKLKLYFRKRTQRVSVFGLSVSVDWYFILFCFVVVSVFGLAYAALSYVDISSGSAFREDDEVAEVDETKIKENKISKTVEYLEQR